jgi:hypothetical protein
VIDVLVKQFSGVSIFQQQKLPVRPGLVAKKQEEPHMKHVVFATAAALALGTGAASAAKKCNIVGAFTDSLGSSGDFTSEKKGTVSNADICPDAYKLKVTKLTETVIDVKGKSKDKSCGALTGAFTFNDGGCDSATGSVTIVGIGTLPDTITKTQDNTHAEPDHALLSHGMN